MLFVYNDGYKQVRERQTMCPNTHTRIGFPFLFGAPQLNRGTGYATYATHRVGHATMESDA